MFVVDFSIKAINELFPLYHYDALIFSKSCDKRYANAECIVISSRQYFSIEICKTVVQYKYQ